jgi:hypothetical protein
MTKRFHNYKSRTKGELIPAVIVEFHSLQNLYCTKDQWDNGVGPYHKFLKDNCIPVGEVKKLHRILLNPDDFPTEEWNP